MRVMITAAEVDRTALRQRGTRGLDRALNRPTHRQQDLPIQNPGWHQSQAADFEHARDSATVLQRVEILRTVHQLQELTVGRANRCTSQTLQPRAEPTPGEAPRSARLASVGWMKPLNPPKTDVIRRAVEDSR